MENTDCVHIEAVAIFGCANREAKNSYFELRIEDPDHLLTDKMREDILKFVTYWYENDESELDLWWDGVSSKMDVKIGAEYQRRYWGTVEIEKLSEGLIVLIPWIKPARSV